ncbi:hypothetical protein PR202_gb28127 [Eleusine coracana subsp. coracana]|uniref:SKP1-like protein n=1 Tax=Eleusine coracana subsp. coracana TaxID=191504 RepID=A0AAV5FVY9_ELECO|nr:hypothetical protein QOZ80_6AG0547350 [Eleusine coracana subsp. coracana]GJN39033.1 hypothetical protein PR202_gb28127 [Eleusine coracana subsp. coracana]
MAAPESAGDGSKGATRMVTLISSDNERFKVNEAAASLSLTVHRKMLEGGGDIPLPNVDGATLSKVLEYCRKHAPAAAGSSRGEQPAADGSAAAAAALISREDLARFDNEFVMIDPSMLCSIIRAAQALQIEGLLDITCNKVADLIKGKTPKEIRRTFRVPDPKPKPEEQAEIVAENAWAFK